MWPFSYAYPESHVANIDGQTYDYIVVGGESRVAPFISRSTLSNS